MADRAALREIHSVISELFQKIEAATPDKQLFDGFYEWFIDIDGQLQALLTANGLVFPEADIRDDEQFKDVIIQRDGWTKLATGIPINGRYDLRRMRIKGYHRREYLARLSQAAVLAKRVLGTVEPGGSNEASRFRISEQLLFCTGHPPIALSYEQSLVMAAVIDSMNGNCEPPTHASLQASIGNSYKLVTQINVKIKPIRHRLKARAGSGIVLVAYEDVGRNQQEAEVVMPKRKVAGTNWEETGKKLSNRL